MVKKLLFLAILIAVITAAYFLPFNVIMSKTREIGDYLSSLGWLGYILFITMFAASFAIGAPRLLLYVIGGLAFGPYWGLLCGQAGAIIGAYATFLFSRRMGDSFALKKWPSLNKLSKPIEDKGIFSVLLIRQMPVGGFYINIFLGLSNIRHRDFLLGSFIGFLPEAIPATMIGAGLLQGSLTEIVQITVLAIACLILFSYLFKRSLQARSKS